MATQKENVELIFSGDEYFHRAMNDIRNAQTEVCVEFYIFNLDLLGNLFLQELCEAHHRGVRVRLMVDGVGSLPWIPTLRQRSRKEGFSFLIYHELPFNRLFLMHPRQLLDLFRKMNKRNHRKLILIDQKIVYLGSFNVSQLHCEKFTGAKAWRDTGVRLEYPHSGYRELDILRQSFQHIWIRAKYLFGLTIRRRQPMAVSRFRMNSTALSRMKLLLDLRKKLYQAETRILVTNAYFVPRRRFMSELRKAARRGVYVALCLPAKTDVWFVREASWSVYHRLIKDGVHVYEYQPRVLHAKTMIIDNWATVGSHNLNHRSLVHDLEVETVIHEPPLIKQLLAQWDSDIKQSHQVTLQELGNRPLWRRAVSRILWWFRYWL